MTKKSAFELCKKLNPPFHEQKPNPFAVYAIGREYYVEHLSTKTVVKNEKEGRKLVRR